MERYAWKATIRSGKEREYIRRHNEIWQEMKDELKRAGICNYSIWLCGDEVFGYYECADGAKFASAYQANSPTVKKWQTYMDEVMIMEQDKETGAQPHLEEVFYLE